MTNFKSFDCTSWRSRLGIEPPLKPPFIMTPRPFAPNFDLRFDRCRLNCAVLPVKLAKVIRSPTWSLCLTSLNWPAWHDHLVFDRGGFMLEGLGHFMGTLKGKQFMALR